MDQGMGNPEKLQNLTQTSWSSDGTFFAILPIV
jgi:hypothetical protein